LKSEVSREKEFESAGTYVNDGHSFFHYRKGVITISIKPNSECISLPYYFS